MNIEDLFKAMSPNPAFPPRPTAHFQDAARRAYCLLLAAMSLPKSASTYDLIAAADYLDRGHQEEQPERCVNECEACDAQGEGPSYIGRTVRFPHPGTGTAARPAEPTKGGE